MLGWFRKALLPTPTPEDVKWGIIEKSLLNEPEQWELTTAACRAIHKGTGFVLWVANEDYGLSGGFDKGILPASRCAADQKPSPVWSKRLWKAARLIKEGKVVATQEMKTLEVVEAFEKHLNITQ